MSVHWHPAGRVIGSARVPDAGMTCTCARICIGMEMTEYRNWNPDCLEHGPSSAWYQSPEQIQKRHEQNQKLRDLYRRAREARNASKQP